METPMSKWNLRGPNSLRRLFHAADGFRLEISRVEAVAGDNLMLCCLAISKDKENILAHRLHPKHLLAN